MLLAIVLMLLIPFIAFMFIFPYVPQPKEEDQPSYPHLYPQTEQFFCPPIRNKIIYNSSIKNEDLKLAIYENMVCDLEYTIPYIKEMFEYTNNDEPLSTQRLCTIMNSLCYDEKFKVKRQMAYEGRLPKVYYVKEK